MPPGQNLRPQRRFMCVCSTLCNDICDFFFKISRNFFFLSFVHHLFFGSVLEQRRSKFIQLEICFELFSLYLTLYFSFFFLSHYVNTRKKNFTEKNPDKEEKIVPYVSYDANFFFFFLNSNLPNKCSAVNPGQIDTILFLCTIGIMMIVPKSHNQLTDFFIFYCKNNVENDEKKTIIRFRCMFLGFDFFFFPFFFLSIDNDNDNQYFVCMVCVCVCG